MALPAISAMKAGLVFTGMTDLGVNGGFDLQFSLADKNQDVFLCVGNEDNTVPIGGTTPKTRQAAVLNAIDTLGKWTQKISLWMVSKKDGAVSAKTQPVLFTTHVKPFYGKLRISEIAADQPAMKYPGNGKGRVLSGLINDRYYFRNGSRFETDDQFRGFDCTTFPMALLSITELPMPGYGKQLCDAANATKCDLEQLTSEDLKKRFADNTIPGGLYILFSEGHVMLYNSDLNTLYEFNFGWFRATPAAQRELKAPRDLWWMRKLAEKYRPCFT